MKLASSILTIAALATTTSAAAINKDKRRNKKQTIFHKPIDGTPKNGGAESLLDNVKAQRRNRRENQVPKMEKTTKVKRDDIVKRGLARHGVLKQKEKEEVSPAEEEGGFAAAVEKETEPDEAIPVEPLVKAFESEEFVETTGTGTGTTSAPAMAPTVQEVMQKRRQDRSTEMKERMATYATEAASTSNNGGRATTAFERSKDRKTTTSASTSRNASGKRERRMSSSTTTAPGAGRQQREPNPRPGRRTVSTTADKNKRDLRPSDSKPGPGALNKRDLKKSKKSSYSSKASGSSGTSSSEYDCQVRMTNLSKEQWFSDIFWMVHSDKIRVPLWAYGFPAFDDLAKLAQDGDPDELIDFYEDNDDGVLEVDAERGPIMEGESIFFGIPKSGKYNRLTLATSFIFSNDGFVSIRNEDIYDGAEWYLWGLDAGVEANTQLCWTVQAGASDFPPNSECFAVKDDDILDENDNSFPGEGFVHVHSGIHDLQNKNDLQDFLSFTCKDLNVNSFVEYFQEIGFDDDVLLFDDDRLRNERDDESFLDYVEDNDDKFGDYIIFGIALDAGDFNDFCDELEDISDFLFNTFETLEPQVFDFRTPMMKVELIC